MRHSDSLKTDSQIIPVCGKATLQPEKCSEQCHYVCHIRYVYPYVQVGLSNWWYVLPIQVTSCSHAWNQLFLFLGTAVLMADGSCSCSWTQLYMFSFLDAAVFVPGRSCSHARTAYSWEQLLLRNNRFQKFVVAMMPSCKA